MTAWRLHLTDRAIMALDILSGKIPELAVWSQPDRVAFYQLEDGAFLEDRLLDIPMSADRTENRWPVFLSELVSPNGSALPIVEAPNTLIYTTNDGKFHLYVVKESQLIVHDQYDEIPLKTPEVDRFVAVGFDRAMGMSASLERSGKLYLFQQDIPLGVQDLGLTMGAGSRPAVAVADDGVAIFVTDGYRVVMARRDGKPPHQFEFHYLAQMIACSPNGLYLATVDADNGVIRVYEGVEVTLAYQRFSVDLIAQARQLQLLADLPSVFASVSALAIDNVGRLAFAVSGVVCVTDVSYMDRVPRPQRLL